MLDLKMSKLLEMFEGDPEGTQKIGKILREIGGQFNDPNKRMLKAMLVEIAFSQVFLPLLRFDHTGIDFIAQFENLTFPISLKMKCVMFNKNSTVKNGIRDYYAQDIMLKNTMKDGPGELSMDDVLASDIYLLAQYGTEGRNTEIYALPKENIGPQNLKKTRHQVKLVDMPLSKMTKIFSAYIPPANSNLESDHGELADMLVSDALGKLQ